MNRLPLCFLTLLLAACGADNPPTQPTQSAVSKVQKQVGEHQLRLVVPEGWQLIDQGTTLAFRKSGILLEFQDLGAFSWSGVKHQIEAAEKLFRQGDALAAQEGLRQLPYLQALFLQNDEWGSVKPLWEFLTRRQQLADSEKVSHHYDELLNSIAQQPELDFQAVTQRLLTLEDRHNQREIFDRQKVMIHGRRAERVNTWDRLSHSMRKSHLYVLNGDNILEFSVKLGAFDAYAVSFDQIVDSLEFD